MESHEQRNKRWRQQEAKLAGYVAVFATGIFVLYFGFFTARKFAVGDPQSWAGFGDYFGGLVNPVVGIVTVILVIRTLHATRAESDLTREEMKAQTALFTAQLARYDKEKVLTELQRRLDGALSAWESALSQPYGSLRSELLPEYGIGGASSTFGRIFSDGKIEAEIEAARRNPHVWEKVYLVRWTNLAEDIANLLREIALYCDDYDAQVGDKLVTDFYRRRVNKGMRVLKAVGMVQPRIHESLKVGRLSFADL